MNHFAADQEFMNKNMKSIEKVANRLFYLFERWEDEKHYESWTDYNDQMRIAVNEIPGWSFLKSSKRPFGCSLIADGVEFKIILKPTRTRIGVELRFK